MTTLPLGHAAAEDDFARFVDWCHALMSERPGVQQYGGDKNKHTLTLKDGPAITFLRDPATGNCAAESTDPLPPEVVSILREAGAHAARGDLGQSQWWRVTFTSHNEMDATFGLHMMRLLGQRRAFVGRWRLGQDALIEFSVEDPKQLIAFTKQTLKVTFRCPGPGHGPRAGRFAQMQADAIRAVLSFCTATTLGGGVGFPRPVNEPEFPRGSAVNLAIQELSVGGIPIWSRISEAAATGAIEFTARVLNALTAFEHAHNQPTDGAATMFYVSAIEALTVPNHKYLHLRVTNRFVNSLVDLAKPKLEETLKHANFVEAYGTTLKTPKQLAERIYHLRSSPVHTGRFGLSRNVMLGLDSMSGQIRTALLAEIAEAAIVEFVQCPFTSLIGHMDFDPACRVELSDEEHSIVRSAAVAKGISIEDYILQCLSLPARPRRQ